MAERGLTLPQIKNVTGHKSDKVVQGYINRSRRMGMIGAEALAVGSQNDIQQTVQATTKKRTFEEEIGAGPTTLPPPTTFVFNFNNCNDLQVQNFSVPTRDQNSRKRTTVEETEMFSQSSQSQ